MTILDSLSMQLYSGRKFPPLAEQCALVARLGIRNVEPYGGLLDDVDGLADALSRHGLAAPSSHIGLDMLADDFDGAVDIARRLGIGVLVVPAVPSGERKKDAAGWRALGRQLGDLQRRLKDRGIRLAWHNHDFEFKKSADGHVPMDLILEAAPDLLWEVDIAWISRAGEDPARWIERYRNRVVAFHVKDIAPAGENADEDGWADIGSGTIDWAALLPVMQSTRAELYVLEHDNPSDFARFATRSRDAVAAW